MKSLRCRLGIHMHVEEYGVRRKDCGLPACAVHQAYSAVEMTCLECGHRWYRTSTPGYNLPPRDFHSTPSEGD